MVFMAPPPCLETALVHWVRYSLSSVFVSWANHALRKAYNCDKSMAYLALLTSRHLGYYFQSMRCVCDGQLVCVCPCVCVNHID